MPVDALVSLASVVLPGDLLQQIVLFLTLGLAAFGAGLVLPADRPLARCVAAVAYGWNPYVAERLGQGHWSLLIGYAALPYVLRAGADAGAGVPRAWPRLLLASAIAAVTPTGGLLAAVLGTAVLIAAAPTRRADTARDPGRGGDAGRRGIGGAAGARGPVVTAYLLAVVVVNLPWIVPGALRPGNGTDPAGVAAFSARAENWSGSLGSLLGLGGIWNAAVVPGSRTTVAAPLLSALVLALAVAGWPALRRQLGPAAWGLAATAGLGLWVAVAGITDDGRHRLRVLIGLADGAGLLRDGQKLLAPLALLLALGAGLGTQRLAGRVRSRPAGAVLAALLLALPVVTTPELAGGDGLGRSHYPADWAAVDRVLGADDRPGDVVALPYEAFRVFGWTGGRTVLDPAPRYFGRTVVTADALAVRGPDGLVVVRGEDARSAAVGAALRQRDPALGRLGIGWVLVEHGTPGDATVPAGATLVYAGPDLSLYRTAGYAPAAVDRPPAAPVLAGDALAVLLVLGSAWQVAYRRRQRSLPAGTV